MVFVEVGQTRGISMKVRSLIMDLGINSTVV